MPNLSFGVEYNFAHINIRNRNQFVFPGFAVPETVTNADSDIHTIWARANLRFGGPVIAKF
jgi:hypothetical protein